MDHSVQGLFNLAGRVALITGGAGWLGSAMTEALAEAGAAVAVVDKNPAALQALARRMDHLELPVTTLAADAAQEEPLRRCIDRVAADHGRLDILVNGAYHAGSPLLDEITFQEMDQALHGGPSAYCIAAQQAARHMRRTGGGSIINIGSMYGVVTGYPRVYDGLTRPNSLPYQAGKAAILQLTRHLAVYWARDNIRVNSLSPGAFPNHDGQSIPGFVGRLEENVPLGRIGRPWEVKGAVVFLASDASSYVTGQNLLVDGGWTVW